MKFPEARNIEAPAIDEHAGTACHGKAAFSVMAARINGNRLSHARTSRHAISAFFATHALKPCFTFGASESMRHAIGRGAHAQSGCLSFGSPLISQRRQSATRHRQMGRASFGARRTGCVSPRSTGIGQNLWKHQLSKWEAPVYLHEHEDGTAFLCSSPSPSLASLTGWSRGRPVTASRFGNAKRGAPYRRRYASALSAFNGYVYQ
jgi:hypothetical protein